MITSIYLISLLRLVSLRKAAKEYTPVQSGDGDGAVGAHVPQGVPATAPSPLRVAARRLTSLVVDRVRTIRWRFVAPAAGWITLFVIAAACQFFLFVLILETSTSNTCDVKSQTGCRSGEYCSVSIAKGQCNDCSVILPETTTCRRCPNKDRVLLPDYEHHLPEHNRCVQPHVQDEQRDGPELGFML